MIDFLTFKSFIAIDFFILFYYIGAVGMPIWMIYNYRYITEPTIIQKVQIYIQTICKKCNIKVIFVLCFIFLEIMWRICFEMIIGYFQLIQAIKLAI